ncbi:MAG: serine/threonine-protein kinase [Planctomycetota bacterium]
MTLQVSGKLGPYVLKRELGRGGMGVVYLAEDPRGGLAAVKTLLDPDAPAELLERFRREGTTLATVQHPHVVRVLGSSFEPPHPWIAFEFVPGGDLEQRVERAGPLPWREAVERTVELTRGLEAIHARGALHRDVKPRNVLLGEHGAKLSDFGLLKVVDQRSLTQAGTPVGSPSYMAPEQTGARRGPWTPATDVYGLGATLYFMLTGTPPYRGPSAVATLIEVLERAVPSPRAQAPSVPGWLDALCRQALAKDPTERPPTPAAFRELLLATAVTAPSEDARSRRSLKVVAGASLLLALAALSALGLSLHGRKPQGTATAPPAEQEPEPLVPPPAVPPPAPAERWDAPWARSVIPEQLRLRVRSLEQRAAYTEAAELLEREGAGAWEGAAKALARRLHARARVSEAPSASAAVQALEDTLSAPDFEPSLLAPRLEALAAASADLAPLEGQVLFALGVDRVLVFLERVRDGARAEEQTAVLRALLDHAPELDPRSTWRLVAEVCGDPLAFDRALLVPLTEVAEGRPPTPVASDRQRNEARLASLYLRSLPPNRPAAQRLLAPYARGAVLPDGVSARLALGVAALEAGDPSLALAAVRGIRDTDDALGGYVLQQIEAAEVEAQAHAALGTLAEYSSAAEDSWSGLTAKALARVHAGEWELATELLTQAIAASKVSRLRDALEDSLAPEAPMTLAEMSRAAAISAGLNRLLTATRARDLAPVCATPTWR